MAVDTIDLADLPAWLAKNFDPTKIAYQPALKICAILISNDIRDNFKAECDADKNPTPPLTCPRPQQRGKGQRGRSPAGTTHQLWDTGRLAASYGAGAPGNVYQLGRFELIYGSNLMTPDGRYSLAAIHHYGATIPERRRAKPYVWEDGCTAETVFARRIRETHIPPRPRAGLGVKLIGMIEDVVAQEVVRQLTA